MTEGKDSKSEPKDEWKLNQEQYDRLLECSKKGPEGIKEWNKWRYENPDEQIWLQGADLDKANLQGADLRNANLQRAELQGADLSGAGLQGADLSESNLEGAKLSNAELQGAHFWGANLQGADLVFANLQEAYFLIAKLQGAKFMEAIVNGSTSFLSCKIDENTDFRETALENTRIESSTKYLLKYNIRRMNWRDWYWGGSNHKVFDKDEYRPRRRARRVLWRLLITWPVRLFWKMSNYGRSSGRIILTFFALAIGFAFVYSLWPCCVVVNDVVGDIRGFVHALYFSVVTMTTLGFGDIAANPDSWPGQVLLMFQVILGYVLLGAMVTRLAVLFTSDGPAGSFTPMAKETKELLVNLKERWKKVM